MLELTFARLVSFDLLSMNFNAFFEYFPRICKGQYDKISIIYLMFHGLKKFIQELRQIIETLSILSSSNIQF